MESIVELSTCTRKLIAAGTKNEEIRKEDVNQITIDTAAALGALVISRDESSLWFGRPTKTLLDSQRSYTPHILVTAISSTWKACVRKSTGP